jgi:hypothetical protein
MKTCFAIVRLLITSARKYGGSEVRIILAAPRHDEQRYRLPTFRSERRSIANVRSGYRIQIEGTAAPEAG